jgi:hypothetical protein
MLTFFITSKAFSIPQSANLPPKYSPRAIAPAVNGSISYFVKRNYTRYYQLDYGTSGNVYIKFILQDLRKIPLAPLIPLCRASRYKLLHPRNALASLWFVFRYSCVSLIYIKQERSPIYDN